jgi:hypothetical protein
MCWKCDAVEIKEPPGKLKRGRVDTWHWFGVIGLGFMVLSVITFAVGFINTH